MRDLRCKDFNEVLLSEEEKRGGDLSKIRNPSFYSECMWSRWFPYVSIIFIFIFFFFIIIFSLPCSFRTVQKKKRCRDFEGWERGKDFEEWICGLGKRERQRVWGLGESRIKIYYLYKIECIIDKLMWVFCKNECIK